MSLLSQKRGSGSGTVSLVGRSVGRTGSLAPRRIHRRPFSPPHARVTYRDGPASADPCGFVGSSLESPLARWSFWCGGGGGPPPSPSKLSCRRLRSKGCPPCFASGRAGHAALRATTGSGALLGTGSEQLYTPDRGTLAARS